ncbi:MAG TPA: hypothetical protein VN461_17965 [Vicinamibacteria bacterium]|nr:hypothetical protein [Vicinamibacteria bacterium]
MVGLALLTLLQFTPTGSGVGDGVTSLPAANPPAWASVLIRLEPPPGPDAASAEARSLCPANGPRPDSVVAVVAREEAATHVSLIGFSETSALDYSPLTRGERWRLFLNQTVTSPGAFAPVLATAVLAQRFRTPPEWGDNTSGFGKRMALAFGTNVVQGVIQSAGDAMLKQDPRFIRSGQRGFWRRAAHAVQFTVFTYDDRGRTCFGTANVASFYGSSIASALLYPPGHHAWREGVQAANLQLAMSAAFNVFQEFWPDIQRTFRRSH